MWFRCALAATSVAALTAVMGLLDQVLPLGGFPLPYILLATLVAYLLGNWPSLITFLLGLVAFAYYFVHPGQTMWPLARDLDQRAAIATYVIGATIGSTATLVIRRRNERLLRLTEQLSEAKELAESRHNQLEAVLLGASEGVLVVNTDRTIAYANSAADRLFGQPIRAEEPVAALAEAVGTREIDASPFDVEQLAVIQALVSGVFCERTHLIKGQSGPDTVVNARASPIRGPDGRIEGAVAIFGDITAQRRTEDALRHSEEKYRNLVELVPNAIAEVDTSGVLTFANSALCKMYGRAMHEVIGRHIWDAAESETEAEALKSHFSGLAAECLSPEPYRTRITTKGGKLVDIRVDWSYKRDCDGRVTGYTAVITDVTDETKSLRELERGYEHEHRIAETMQSSLMRPVPRRIGGFAFEKLYKAASEEARVGGDFYDVFQLDADKVGIVIGDVSGKGLKAAVQVAAAKYSLRGRAYESYSPGTVMNQVNRTLVQDLDAEGFISVFLGILDRDEKTLSYANAGHAPVIHWDCSESSAALCEPTGPVVGVDADAVFDERQIQLKPGDELLLGTDGLYEIRCGDSFLEIDCLLRIYVDMKSQGVSSAMELVERVVSFCHGDLRDDIAILRVSVEG